MKHNLTLDYVQKGLERFLDRKRRAFARFYFLSNDDLLNILSNAQDARAVQQHVQKMFDNVASLRLEEVTGGTVDVTHLVSAEGEAFKLGRNLKVHGEVDEWLGNVELNMKAQLQRSLKKGINDFLKIPREDFALSETPGQVITAVSQIMWARGTEAAITGRGGPQILALLGGGGGAGRSIPGIKPGDQSSIGKVLPGASSRLSLHSGISGAVSTAPPRGSIAGSIAATGAARRSTAGGSGSVLGPAGQHDAAQSL